MSRKNVTSLKLSKIQGRWALFPETKSCPVLIRLCHIIDGKFVSEKTRGSPVTIFKEMTSKKRKHKRWNTFKLLKYSTAWLSKSSGCWRSTVRLVRLSFRTKIGSRLWKSPGKKRLDRTIPVTTKSCMSLGKPSGIGISGRDSLIFLFCVWEVVKKKVQ